LRFTRPFAHVAHRLGGIQKKIEGDLLQFDPIASNRRQASLKLFVVIVASENRLKQVMLEPPGAVRSGKQSHRSP